VTPNISEPSYPSPHLLTIPNHPLAFLLRKKAVDGKNQNSVYNIFDIYIVAVRLSKKCDDNR
jgi:hypothetical protein